VTVRYILSHQRTLLAHAMSSVGRARENLSPIQVSIAGGLSGVVTRLLLQPLDVAKIRLQLQVEGKSKGTKYRGLIHLFLLMPREEGIKSLWKGHLPAQVLSFTYGIASFAAFESLSRSLSSSKYFGNPSPSPSTQFCRHFLCGGAAGCAGTLASLPFDVVRTRLVAQPAPVKASVRHAVTQLHRQGGPRAFFKGLVPAVASTAPQTGLQFAFYTLLTILRDDIFGVTDNRISFLGSLSCGGLAGMGSKAILYPLDVVKKRLQVTGWEGREGLGSNPSYRGLTHCVKKILLTEGIRGFYKGFSAAILKAVLSTSLHFAVYEKCCLLLMLGR